MLKLIRSEFLAAATAHEGLPAPTFAEIAFAGRSNVGKSSLINRMLQRKGLAKTSSKPGCTRGLVLFRVHLRAKDAAENSVLDLVDLPGYGYAKRSKQERQSWGPMVENFLRERAGLRTVVLILDIRRGAGPEDIQLLDFLDSIGTHATVVATKMDKLPANKRKTEAKRLSQALGRRVHTFSSQSGDGQAQLWRHLLGVAALLPATPPPTTD